eukprot:COSAG02_NODE_63132_length_264_cov_0.612121_2_plen_24_part_01
MKLLKLVIIHHVTMVHFAAAVAAV